jgi:hypothetical protein
MKALVAVATLLALAGTPSIAAANITRASPPVVAQTTGLPVAAVPAPVAGTRADASDYAAREAAAPALAEFAGGGGGIYIGSGAVVIILLVIIIVILL